MTHGFVNLIKGIISYQKKKILRVSSYGCLLLHVVFNHNYSGMLKLLAQRDRDSYPRESKKVVVVGLESRSDYTRLSSGKDGHRFLKQERIKKYTLLGKRKH